MSTTLPRLPQSPVSAFLWAGYWALAATVGFFVLFSLGGDGISELSGRRTRGMLLAGPFFALAFAILLIVIGVRRIAARARLGEPVRESLRVQRLSERASGPWIPFIILGVTLAVIVIGGSTVIAFVIASGVNRNHDPQISVGVLIFMASLLSAAWLFLLQCGFLKLAARRSLHHSGSHTLPW